MVSLQTGMKKNLTQFSILLNNCNITCKFYCGLHFQHITQTIAQSIQLRDFESDDRGSILGRGKRGFFLYATTPRLTLGFAQAIKWVPGVLSTRKSGRGVKLTTQLHLVPRLTKRGAIPPFPHSS
jgi:hypothetical protein